MSRYELVEGKSRKFWEVSLRGTQLVVRWGRIGAAGQSKVHEFPTAAAAREKQAALIREKTAKGYRPVGSTDGGDEPTPAAPTRRPGNKADGAAKRPARAAASDKAQRPRSRLRAAFEALKAMGIVALENAGYTQSDGWDDVNEIANRLNQSGKRPRAGVFYHGQDVARGRRGEGLFLTFGSYAARDANADSEAVGHLIVDVLKSHGFRPKWDGKHFTRIHTGKFEWK